MKFGDWVEWKGLKGIVTYLHKKKLKNDGVAIVVFEKKVKSTDKADGVMFAGVDNVVLLSELKKKWTK